MAFQAGTHNLRRKQAGANSAPVTKTATATLTQGEVINSGFIIATHASVAIAITIPAAAGVYKGYELIVAQGGAAAVTVVCAAGYGGGGAATDTVTLAQGQFAKFVCDGSAWFYQATGAAA